MKLFEVNVFVEIVIELSLHLFVCERPVTPKSVSSNYALGGPVNRDVDALRVKAVPRWPTDRL